MEQLLVSDMIFNLEKHFAVKVQGDEVKKIISYKQRLFCLSRIACSPLEYRNEGTWDECACEGPLCMVDCILFLDQ